MIKPLTVETQFIRAVDRAVNPKTCNHFSVFINHLNATHYFVVCKAKKYNFNFTAFCIINNFQ